MSKRVRVAFIGSGGIAMHFHLPALQKIEEVEFIAFADAREEQAQMAADKFGGRMYVDYHEMLEKEDLDAIFVCVPPYAHSDTEILAAQKGCHLFIEKPVVLTMDKGFEIAEAIRKADVISCAGYQVRYMPIADAARNFLAEKSIALVAGNRWGGVPGDEHHWWRVMAKSGGMIHEMATHNIDFIRYCIGEIDSVYARQSLNALNNIKNLTVPDAEVAVFEFKNGAIGYFSTSCALMKGGGWNSTDVILQDMMLRISFSEITVVPEDAAKIELLPAGMEIQEAFIHAICTGDRSVIRSDYEDALKTSEVTLAVAESARTGRPVKMTLS